MARGHFFGGKFHGFLDNGDPAVAGKLYSWLTNTGRTQLKNTYADAEVTTPNANPVILDDAGRATVVLEGGSYDFELRDADSGILWSITGYSGQTGAHSVAFVNNHVTLSSLSGPHTLILADATSGPITVTLYSSAGNTGHTITVQKIDGSANVVTVVPAFGQTINGLSFVELPVRDATVELTSNSSYWSRTSQETHPFPAGTLALPGVALRSVDLGMYSPAVGWLAFATNGQQGLSMNSVAMLNSPTQPRCSLYHGQVQSIATATPTVLLMDSEDFDVPSGFHTGSGVITVPVGGDGLYLVGAACKFPVLATTIDATLYIQKGTPGAAPASTAAEMETTGASSRATMHVIGLVSLAAGNTLSAVVIQNSGGNVNVGGVSREASNQIWAVKLW